jgi:CSLREA domain-containing protein
MASSIRSPVLPLAILPLLVLAACGDEGPTAPVAPPLRPKAGVTAVQRLVNSLADPGTGGCTATECTLREAIKDPASTAISFTPGLTGTLTLASPARGGGSLVIDKALTITGPGAGVVIRRRATDPEFRILRIGKAGVVTLKNLTLRGGKTALPGGGIMNFGSLVLDNCRVRDNISGAHGGGIDNHGPLILTNSKVIRNAAASRAGIDNHNDNDLAITTSSVSYNSGTGVFNDGGTLTITNSTFAGNSGAGIGQYRGAGTLDRVKVLENGGGLGLTNTDMTIRNSTVARNGGTGIKTLRSRDIFVLGSTIADNAGDGVHSEAFGRAGASIDISNSTISGNLGNGFISEDDTESFAHAQVTSTTVAFNAGHGVAMYGGNGNSLTLRNSIVALNGAPTVPDFYVSNFDYVFIAASFSLIGDGTGSGIANEEGNQVGNVSPNSAPVDPLLGALTNNGGATATHALLAGSPALDTGTSEGCPATDQRGVVRPQGPACDMGSFERQAQ